MSCGNMILLDRAIHYMLDHCRILLLPKSFFEEDTPSNAGTLIGYVVGESTKYEEKITQEHESSTWYIAQWCFLSKESALSYSSLSSLVPCFIIQTIDSSRRKIERR